MRPILLPLFPAPALLASTVLAQLRTLPYNFTLAAWNKTGTNANDTGVPLVLGQNGAVDGAEFKVLSVRHFFVLLACMILI